MDERARTWRTAAALALLAALGACERSVLLGSDEALDVAPDAPALDVEDFDGPLVHPPDAPADIPPRDAVAEAPVDVPAPDVAPDAGPDAGPDVAPDATLPDVADAPDGDAPADVTPDLPRPARVPPTRSIALGDRHACAAAGDGALWCWGANDRGQLGDGTTTARARPEPVAGLRGVTALAAGAEHTCALVGARAWCWGRGGGRLLRAGEADAPRPFDTGVDATALAAGEAHTCALRAGAVSCWGADDAGQLGGVAAGAVVPLPQPASSLHTGAAFTCARLTGGAVWCWGSNREGQLGRGTLSPRELPGAVLDVAGATEVRAGARHACAAVGGSLRCWGDRADGQLGDGAGPPRPTPATVAAWSPFEAFGCGAAFTCVRSDSVVRCAGRNDRGQLGDGTTTARTEPVTTAGFPRTRFSLLAVGARHACAETTDAQTWCWGDGADGQLGNGALGVSTTREPVLW